MGSREVARKTPTGRKLQVNQKNHAPQASSFFPCCLMGSPLVDFCCLFTYIHVGLWGGVSNHREISVNHFYFFVHTQNCTSVKALNLAVWGCFVLWTPATLSVLAVFPSFHLDKHTEPKLFTEEQH